jgi:hypothetical protein
VLDAARESVADLDERRRDRVRRRHHHHLDDRPEHLVCLVRTELRKPRPRLDAGPAGEIAISEKCG